MSTVKLTVNGKAVSADVEDRTLLVHLLRDGVRDGRIITTRPEHRTHPGPDIPREEAQVHAHPFAGVKP